MIAVFEDIGLARKKKIISRNDFITSYGGRFAALVNSGAIEKFMRAAGYKSVHFARLDILKNDLNLFERKNMTRLVEFIIKDSSKKISINPNNVTAVEQIEEGSIIFLDSGKSCIVTAEYESAAAMIIHDTDSEKRASRNLIQNSRSRPERPNIP